MSEKSNLSLSARIFIQAVLNIGLVWVMATQMDQYFSLTKSFTAYLVVGALLTLMNIFVRPILHIITFPFKLFAMILAIIIVNGAFVQLTVMIVQRMDQNIVQLDIFGGLWGWIVVASVFGVGNWVMKLVLR